MIVTWRGSRYHFCYCTAHTNSN